jgi:sugar phosphate isomerase/epimerase
MSMSLACADFTFPLLPHDDVLKLIAMLKFEGVDVGLFEERSHLWPSREYVHPEKSGRELKKKTDDLGIKVADVFLQMRPDFEPYAINHPESPRREKAREWFTKTLDYAQACGAKHVSTIPGVFFEKIESKDTSFKRSIDELKWRVDQAKARQLTFHTEAHVGSIAPDPESAKKMVTSVPGLTLTLDYTHFTRTGFPDSAVEPLVQYAGHIHVRGAREGRLQTKIQDNTIDYARVMDRLKAANYNGWVGVEYVWIDWEHCNECDNLAETIQFRDFLRKHGAG